MVDMEAFAQARHFAQSDIAFSVLKMVTDDADGRLDADFAARLPAVREHIRKLLAFLQPVSHLPVTVVIPVHNRADHIEACLDSVLTQSEPADEIIVVDDASSDDTVQRVRAYGEVVRLLRLPTNRGVSAARNLGIETASSPWIALLDSDDRWRPDKLAAQRRFVRRYPHYQILQSEEIWIRRGKRVNRHKHHAKPHGWVWRPSLERCLISPSAVLMHRDLIAECGDFDEDLPVCEDYDLWLRMSRWHPVGLDKTPSLTKYSGHADQLSTRLRAMDRFRVYAMLKALRHEKEGEHRQALLAVLEEKLGILAAGSEKRGLMDSAHRYRQLWQQALAGEVDLEEGWMLY
jgi:GT2 family glycosyltransferase